MRLAISRTLRVLRASATSAVIVERLVVVVDHALHELDVGGHEAAALGRRRGASTLREGSPGAPGWITLTVRVGLGRRAVGLRRRRRRIVLLGSTAARQ